MSDCGAPSPHPIGGNTLSGGGTTNTWDSQNRLVRCIAGGHTSTFSYGADGLRRSMTVDNVTTHFLLDGQSVVKELRDVSPNTGVTRTS